MIYPTRQLYFLESVNTRANLFSLGIHPRLKARVWTDKVQVTSGVSMLYHSKALDSYFTSYQRKYSDQHNEWVGIVEKTRCNRQSSDMVHRFKSPSNSRVSLPRLTDLPTFSRGNNLDCEQSLFSSKILREERKTSLPAWLWLAARGILARTSHSLSRSHNYLLL